MPKPHLLERPRSGSLTFQVLLSVFCDTGNRAAYGIRRTGRVAARTGVIDGRFRVS
jgi:hypothetical protein